MFRSHSYNRKYLDFWNARMCKPNVEPLIDKVVVAILKKQGFNDISYVPRNLYDPKSLYEWLSYYDPENSHFIDFKDDGVKAGLDMAFKAFAKPTHVPTLQAIRLDGSLSDVFNLLEIKGDRSAGLTSYGSNKLEAFPVAMRKVRELFRNGKQPDPCLAGLRTQAGKKGRLIWGYPLMMTIIEGSIARPILDYFKGNVNTPMAFGQTSIQLGIRMRKAVAHNDYYVCLDASKFDSSVQAGIIKFGFNILRTWFDPKQKVYQDDKVTIRVEDVFAIVEDYFLHTPIVMPSEKGPTLYRGKRHGVPSGSYFTQIMDSIANVVMVGCLDQLFKLHLRLDEVFVLGDDSLFFTDKRPNLTKYSEALRERFYMKVHSEKCSCGNSNNYIHFLGREWHNGLPHREFTDVVEKAVSPERYRKYEDKWLGASSVLASYGFTALLTGVPDNIDIYQSICSYPIVENSTSGLTDFLIREGIIHRSVSMKLY